MKEKLLALLNSHEKVSDELLELEIGIEEIIDELDDELDDLDELDDEDDIKIGLSE